MERLSKDLYSKDSHFVLELIQNADDNIYPDKEPASSKDLIPSVLFLIEPDTISVYNNETGFSDKQVKAVCDVGSSTKPKENPGFIGRCISLYSTYQIFLIHFRGVSNVDIHFLGQKGIGFKSVFRITDRPEIHSNNYHWCFDINSGPMGYILPHWIPQDHRIVKDKELLAGKL